jgi:hypothetical protein
MTSSTYHYNSASAATTPFATPLTSPPDSPLEFSFQNEKNLYKINKMVIPRIQSTPALSAVTVYSFSAASTFLLPLVMNPPTNPTRCSTPPVIRPCSRATCGCWTPSWRRISRAVALQIPRIRPHACVKRGLLSPSRILSAAGPTRTRQGCLCASGRC